MTKEVNSDYLPEELLPLWEKYLKSDGLKERMQIGTQMYEKFKTLPKAKQQRLMEAFAQQPQGLIIE